MYHQSPTAASAKSPVPSRKMHPTKESDVHLSTVKPRSVTPNRNLVAPTNKEQPRPLDMERISSSSVDSILMMEKPDLHGRMSSSEWVLEMNPADLHNSSLSVFKSLLEIPIPSTVPSLMNTPPADPSKQAGAGKNTSSTAKKRSEKKVRRPIILGEDICVPTDDDVLFGKGGGINKHPGNKTFRQKILDYRLVYGPVYDKSDKKTKTAISLSILKEITREGARFLEKGEDGKWRRVMNEDAARKKISQALRENRATATSKVR